MDTTGDKGSNATQGSAAPAARTLDEVRDRVRMELVRDGFVDEPARGFDPYNGRFGRTTRDVWGNRRRT